MLTRDGDYYIPLADRYRKARKAKADIFISIHAAADPTHTATGSSVFVPYQRGASSPAARWVAEPAHAAERRRGGPPGRRVPGHGDRNGDFQRAVGLARRLEDRGVPVEELVIPNEIHGFLRHASWLAADEATVAFLGRELGEARK